MIVNNIVYFLGFSFESRNFSVYDGFVETHLKRTLIYQNNATSGHKFVITFKPPRLLQYVEIDSSTTLTICEIKFMESGKL